ncbi:MAG: hypothetical protein JO168_19865, partial [Solirubrobacterales bacterium]|nr:hypothetical protein [Solirubrobacterales bacterium]
PSSWGGPAHGVWIWLDSTDHVSRLAQALLSAGHHLERFGKAWDAVGRRHRPPNQGTHQQPVAPEPPPEAWRIFHALPRLSNPVLEEAAAGLADWLGNWAQHLRGDRALPTAIARLWPFAAAVSDRTTDATDYEDKEGAEAKRVAHDSLNSPIGNLAGAFLHSCPNLTEVPHPFEVDGDLRVVRDLVASTGGRAGVVARFRCVTALPYLMQADGAWAETALLSRLEAGPESDVLWRAMVYSPHYRNVMARLGRLMARRAASGGLDMEVRRSLVDRVCSAILSDLWNGRMETDLLPDAQQMLRSVPDELRAHAALAMKRLANNSAQSHKGTPVAHEEIFDHVVEPYLRDVRPQERAAVTPDVAKAFASVPAVSGRRFAQAVAAVRRFLVPFESWSMHDWGLPANDGRSIREGAILGAIEAAAALDLLDLTISKRPDARIPLGLDAVLDHIASQSAALTRDPRFARLAALVCT